MKKIFIFIVIIFSSYQYASSWEGIGVNVGGGYYNYFLIGIPPWVKEDGVSGIFALNFPLAESHLTEIELGVIYYMLEVNGSSKMDATTFYNFRVFFLDISHTFRPSIHIGACRLPIFSWSLGAALDYQLSNKLCFQISGWFLADLTRSFNTNLTTESLPASLLLSFKYYFKGKRDKIKK